MNMAHINLRASNFKVKQKEDTLKRPKSLTIKTGKTMRRGPEFKKINLGRMVAAATTGDYLVNLDLWVIIFL